MIRVLVADDEKKVSQLICNLIDWAALDMQVVGVANNGIEAVEMIESLSPDLVLIDIRMPGYDGLEVVEIAKAKNPALEFIIISGYRYFDYAQQAIRFGVSDYLLKPVNKEELTVTLEKMRRKYQARTQRMSREEELLYRKQSDIEKLRSALLLEVFAPAPFQKEPELEQLNADYYYEMRPGVFQAFVLKIDGSYEALCSGALEVLREKSAETLKQSLAPDCAEFEMCYDESRVFGLLNYEPQKQELLRRQFQGALSQLGVQKEIFPEATVTIALGEPAQHIGGLKGSAGSALVVIDQRLLEGTGGLLEAQGPLSAMESIEPALNATARQIEAALEVLDRAALALALDGAAKQLRGDPSANGRGIVYVADELCNSYLALARKYLLDHAASEAVYEGYKKRSALCSSASELLECLKLAVLDSFDAALERRKLEDTKPIRTAKDYIKKNYMNPITLEQVSCEVGFNASYFSSLFKKETGQNFVEYLGEVRMAKAKELLRESQLSVAQICEKVGYSDLKYFSNSFKKATGLKPAEFRKLYS